jgi:hypothetical protein
MALTTTDTIPISTGADGVYRIGGTRVALDVFIHAFERGATPAAKPKPPSKALR